MNYANITFEYFFFALIVISLWIVNLLSKYTYPP